MDKSIKIAAVTPGNCAELPTGMPNPVPEGARPIPGVKVEPGTAPVVLPPELEFGVPPKVGLVDGVVLPPLKLGITFKIIL